MKAGFIVDGRNNHTISWRTCVRIGVLVVLLFLFGRYWSAVEGVLGLFVTGIEAMIVGFVIAYAVNIPMRFFESKLPGKKGDGTKNRIGALILAILCILIVALFVSLLIIPQLLNAIISLTQELPYNIELLANNSFIASIVPAQIIVQLKTIDWPQLVSDTVAWLQSGVISQLPQMANLVSQIGAWFMGVMFAIWYLCEKCNLSNQCHRLVSAYLGDHIDKKIVNVVSLMDECFHRYIVAQSLEAIIFGGLVAICSALFGLDDPVMLGVLVGTMSLIPMIGAPIGAVLGALIVLATSWQQALGFLVAFFIVQQIEANFIYYRIVGKKVGLEGMWPLIGIMLGTALFGLAGAFIGVPLTAVIFRCVGHDLEVRERLKGQIETPLAKLQKTFKD